MGFDNTLGYLKGGIEAWKKAGKEIDSIRSLSADSVKEQISKKGVPVFDVRKESEYKAEHLVDAENTPLDFLNNHMSEFPEEETFYVHCAGGYRSVIAASILKSRGIHNLVDIAGGFTDLKKTGLPVTNYVCPTTL